ncbi:hypothetical protein EDB84DRAFT_1479993, partial [Lactarius hengduanensis]
GGTHTRAALVRKAESGGTGARLPICAPPGHAPPGPRVPRAHTREGGSPRGRGGSTPPPVRVFPSARTGEGGRRSGTERAPGSLALVPDAQGRGRRFCAFPPRANPGRGGCCSRLERAPREGGRRAASGVARAVPGKRGKGRCARVPPRRPASRVLFMCKRGGGQRRGTYLSRAAPRSCASPPLRANGSGGGGGLSRVRIVRA